MKFACMTSFFHWIYFTGAGRSHISLKAIVSISVCMEKHGNVMIDHFAA